MAVYLVTYQLRPLRNPAPIVEELQRSPSWWHYLDYTWLISTSETIEQFWSRLAPRFITTDHILILEIGPYARYQGWLPKDAWEWMRNH